MERKNLALLCAGVVCFWLFALAFGTAQGNGLRQQNPAVQATADQTTVDQKNETASAVAAQEASAAIADSTNRFKDVTQLAKGINPDILPRMAPL